MYRRNLRESVLDGKRQKNAFVPADLEGEHSVEIKMGGRTDKSYRMIGRLPDAFRMRHCL